MPKTPSTPAEIQSAVARLLATLDLTLAEIVLIGTNPQAKRAARRAMSQALNPPAVSLFWEVKGRRNAQDKSAIYAEAMQIEFDRLLVEVLSDEEREAVEYRFGFTTGEPETLEATAAHCGVFDRKLVRKILEDAYKKLRLVL